MSMTNTTPLLSLTGLFSNQRRIGHEDHHHQQQKQKQTAMMMKNTKTSTSSSKTCQNSTWNYTPTIHYGSNGCDCGHHRHHYHEYQGYFHESNNVVAKDSMYQSAWV
jgi:hypothetical protein